MNYEYSDLPGVITRILERIHEYNLQEYMDPGRSYINAFMYFLELEHQC